ncbi:MAG: J domain-containing protein [Eubacterium sp.]
MNDPYQILGVTRDASDREIKKAYRDLSRKYHPDSYAGKSEAEANMAAEKFKQVQEAYNRIVDERSGKSTGSYGGYGGFGGFGAGQGRQNYSEDEQHMMAAMNYIRARRYNEALNVLNGISNRNAAWYYYSSIANMGLGNNNIALDQARQATDMEPGNMQYRQYYQQLQNGGGVYGGSPFGTPFGGGYGGGSYGGYGSYGGGYNSCGTGNLCCDLWCADTLCECMGGDLCGCM